jgi:hypothetical protein
MVSSLDNWDGSLSSAARQDASRITDLAESAVASTTVTVPDERSNALGNGHGWHDVVAGLDMNTVRCLFDLCIVTQVAVYLVRRVNFGTPIA